MLVNFATIFGGIITAVASLLVLFVLVQLCRIASAQKITAKIVDNFQEFTSRGFLWKNQIIYELNGETIKYKMKSRSLTRRTGDITIYLTNKGNIIEIGRLLELGFLAVLLFIIGIIFLTQMNDVVLLSPML